VSGYVTVMTPQVPSARRIFRTPATTAGGTLATNVARLRPGVAVGDSCVVCAIGYTTTKVSLFDGASVNAVTVYCPIPPTAA